MRGKFKKPNEVLITGCSSGLGKYLHEEIDSISFNRSHPLDNLDIDTVIHCGWDTKITECSEKYINYALDLVKRLCSLKHKKFIFISTIDIYNRMSPNIHKEDEEIDVREIVGLYAITKYFAENIVLKYANNPIIIRPSTLMGRYSNNSISKLNNKKSIPLSGESELNIILYNQIKNFIMKVNNSHHTGVFNLVGTENIKLKNLFPNSKHLFGKFIYNCGQLSNRKLDESFPNIVGSSIDNFIKWQTFDEN